MQNESFPALTGFYRLLFFYIEPISTTVPVFMIWFFPGATWFYNELVPEIKSVSNLHLPAKMAIWQLANCYFLLGLIGSLVFRAARDSLRNDLVAQERIVGALLMALAIADVADTCISVAVSALATPYEIIMKPSSWNGAFIGNVPFTLFLFCCRFWETNVLLFSQEAPQISVTKVDRHGLIITSVEVKQDG
ncbi:hypothetical protein FRC18_010052 [Serendipita sp. 400]|nr:hypothetical protein FRC18_010052 [Serendipita sp. 400]